MPLNRALSLTPLIIASAAPISPAQPIWRDATAELLPMAVTNGRTMDAELVDLDADGDLDLIIASEFGANAVFLNAGRRFIFEQNGITSGRLHDSEDIGVGDFNGDGRLDLVFASEDDRTNELYVAMGPPGTVRFLDNTEQLATEGVSNAVLVGDFNGDEIDDVIFGNAGEPNAQGQARAGGQSEIWLGTGAGRVLRFLDETAKRLPTDDRATQDLEAGDIDGDGDLDILMGAEDGNRIWINDGFGFFTDETKARLPNIDATIETREIDLGDIDGDGDLDAVLANVGWIAGADPRNRVWINDGAGVFTDESDDRLPDAGEFSLDVEIADLDGDGDADLVFGQIGGPGPKVRVMLNDGGGRFEDRTEAWVPDLGMVAVIDVEVADLDRDGRPDLYVANHTSADRILLTSRGR